MIVKSVERQISRKLYSPKIPAKPQLSIIVVSWNTRELLAQCLQAVENDLPTFSEGQVETFVVDNVSSDGSVQMVRERFPWVVVLENTTNIGFAAANNQAIHLSAGRYVLLLNPDTEVKPGALAALCAFLDQNPNAGAAGSLLLNPDESLQLSCHPKPTLSRELWRLFYLDLFYPYAAYRMHQWPRDLAREVDVVQGASLILRREIIDQVGMFDTDYFIYSEEVDLCTRIQRAGWHIYWVPRSVVVHYGGQSTKQVATEMFLHLYKSKILYFRKHYSFVNVMLYKIVLGAASLARLALTPLAWLAPSVQRRRYLQLADCYRRLIFVLPQI